MTIKLSIFYSPAAKDLPSMAGRRVSKPLTKRLRKDQKMLNKEKSGDSSGTAKKIKPASENKAGNGNGSFKKNGHKIMDKLFNRTELDKKIKLARERAGNAVWLGFEKAVAHFENPSVFPLPADNKSVERAFFNFMNTLSKSKRNKVIDKINETLKTSTGARAAKYKDIVNVNFKSAVPIAQQVKTMSVPDELKFIEADINEMEAELKRKAEKPKKTGYATSSKPQQAVASRRVGFFIDNMKCLNPDDVRKDEINLAGFSVDTAGNDATLAPFFVGKFRKDETVLLNNNSKLFTLAIDPLQAVQTFTAGLFIIESDLVSNPDTVNKLALLFAAIALALSLVALGIVIAGTLGAAVTLTSMFIAFFGGLSFSLVSRFIPLIGDDISLAVTDTLTFNGTVDVGATFERTLTIGKGFDINSTFDGKYTATARWVGEQ